MRAMVEALSREEYRALKWAVEEASTWRGALTGGNPGVLQEFEATMQRCERALARLKPSGGRSRRRKENQR